MEDHSLAFGAHKTIKMSKLIPPQPQKSWSRRTGVVNFILFFYLSQNFQSDSNFLILQYFEIWNLRFLTIPVFKKTGMVKNLKFKDFFFKKKKFSKFLILLNFIIRRTEVIKNLKFEPNFQHASNILILPNFIIRRTGVIKNHKFEPHFQHDSNILILPNFIVYSTRVIKNQ